MCIVRCVRCSGVVAAIVSRVRLFHYDVLCCVAIVCYVVRGEPRFAVSCFYVCIRDCLLS